MFIFSLYQKAIIKLQNHSNESKKNSSLGRKTWKEK